MAKVGVIGLSLKNGFTPELISPIDAWLSGSLFSWYLLKFYACESGIDFYEKLEDYFFLSESLKAERLF